MRKLFAILLLLSLLCGIFSACNKEPTQTPQFQALTWPVGAALPAAEAFATSIPEGGTLRYATTPTFTALGDYTLTLIYTDEKGRESEYEVAFCLVLDKEAPVITGVKDLSVYVGDGIAYRSGVTVTDNTDAPVRFTVDSSRVDITRAGSYPVIYTAIDGAGNETVIKIDVYVYEEAVTKDMLFAEIDRILDHYVGHSASIEVRVRRIYDYVHDTIVYDDSSDKNDWVRAAYEGLRTGKGDCFTYFAISKAFFERMGIENMDIQRTPGIVIERHYWNYINIGTKDNPQWYHFDACRLAGVQHSGCLLTTRQLDAYNSQRVDEYGVGNYFYAYDKASYPASSDVIITPTPSLEPYI